MRLDFDVEALENAAKVVPLNAKILQLGEGASGHYVCSILPRDIQPHVSSGLDTGLEFVQVAHIPFHNA